MQREGPMPRKHPRKMSKQITGWDIDPVGEELSRVELVKFDRTSSLVSS
jgi:hypothetical protein